jgi:hypothetical protein
MLIDTSEKYSGFLKIDELIIQTKTGKKFSREVLERKKTRRRPWFIILLTASMFL